MKGRRGSRLEAERELCLLCAGTLARRRAAAPRLRRLAASVDWSDLTDLLAAGRLLPTLGPRVLEIEGARPDGRFRAALEQSLAEGRRQAALLQAIGEMATVALAGAGIRAAGLKGPLLAEAIYGDPGRRLSSDVDLLVAAEDLDGAVAVARGLGYGAPSDHVGADGRPLLHFTLTHERGELPPLEIHWRVHWYEQRFARERLLPPDLGAAAGWRPAPADELAALLLYYARDGFTGLRQAADLGAWWDRFGDRVGGDDLAALAGDYPELRRALRGAALLAAGTVGAPPRPAAGEGPPGARVRAAVRLGSRRTAFRSREQLFAQIGLIDGLLAPPGGMAPFVRRQVMPPRKVVEKKAEETGGRAVSSIGYALRTVARFFLSLCGLLVPGRSPA